MSEKLKWTFSLYDIDKNGFITRKEMGEIVKAIYKLMDDRVKLPDDESTPRKRVDKIFRLMDRDKDGKISLDEFTDATKCHPSLSRLFDCGGFEVFECSVADESRPTSTVIQTFPPGS